jgi:hypothetical protein
VALSLAGQEALLAALPYWRQAQAALQARLDVQDMRALFAALDEVMAAARSP